MKFIPRGLAVLLVACVGSALAQNHISGSQKCGKPDNQQSIEVGDQPGHMLIIEKGGSCTWNAPFELGGLKSTSSTGADFVDATATKFHVQGYGVIGVENGDKAYLRYQGAGTVKEGVATGEGTWFFTGGTGKLKGLKGKGTYKGSGETEGAGESQVEGEYSLPDPSATAKKKGG